MNTLLFLSIPLLLSTVVYSQWTPCDSLICDPPKQCTIKDEIAQCIAPSSSESWPKVDQSTGHPPSQSNQLPQIGGQLTRETGPQFPAVNGPQFPSSQVSGPQFPPPVGGSQFPGSAPSQFPLQRASAGSQLSQSGGFPTAGQSSQFAGESGPQFPSQSAGSQLVGVPGPQFPSGQLTGPQFPPQGFSGQGSQPSNGVFLPVSTPSPLPPQPPPPFPPQTTPSPTLSPVDPLEAFKNLFNFPTLPPAPPPLPSTPSPSNQLQDICLLPPITGHCGRARIMWYYDTETRACERFSFSGCGNYNRFESRQACEERCTKKNRLARYLQRF